MTTITSNTFSDLMTPFGRALIMIFPKTSNTQNYNISIVRDSICSQNKETNISCPTCSLCPKCPTNSVSTEIITVSNGVRLLVFWIVTIILSLIILCTALLCWLYKK